jgi:hypothetical protein
MDNYTIQSNQYIPFRAERGPSGMPLATTYYYVANKSGQPINKNTCKSYRGKQMKEYAFRSEAEAQIFLNYLNQHANN